MSPLARLAFLPLLLLGAAQAQAPLNIRIALVIGNAAYASAPLQNSTNDARAMGEALRGVGFTVIEVRDASRAQMTTAIESAKTALKGKQGVGMLYYAGHGLQLDWRNYMVPVDAKLAKAQDVVEQAVDVTSVIAAFEAAGNRMNIVILDACRDNPFAGTATGKGLAQLDAPPGTFLAYATAPGNVAEDGASDASNGLYTRFLVDELKKPNARIEDVFKRVRTSVRQRSQGRQIPWESTSLEDDFYFDRGLAAAPAPPKPDNLAQRKTEFDKEKADWDRVRDSSKPDDFFTYLQTYPTGFMSEQAQFRLDQLQKVTVEVQPRKDGVVQIRSGARRYEVGDEDVYERTDRVSFQNLRVALKVTAADDLRVEQNNGESIKDQMGTVIKNSTGTKDPGLLNLPADLAVGKRWRSAFRNTPQGGRASDNFYDFHVVGIETIEVPAGRFITFRIEGIGEAVAPDGTASLRTTNWVDATTMTVVKHEAVVFSRGRRFRDSTDVLVSSKRAPRVN